MFVISEYILTYRYIKFDFVWELKLSKISDTFSAYGVEFQTVFWVTGLMG